MLAGRRANQRSVDARGGKPCGAEARRPNPRTATAPPDSTMRMPAAVVFVVALPLLASLTAPLAAQASTGRAMSLAAPVVLGQTATFAMSHPPAAAGNVYGFLWSAPPFPGSGPVVLPGFTVQGLARIDPLTAMTPFLGVFGSAGSVAHSLAVTNVTSLVGYAWDLQGLDLEVATATLWFTDNELTLQVAAAIPSNMVPIPAGSFLMGSSAGPGAPHFSQDIERPV